MDALINRNQTCWTSTPATQFCFTGQTAWEVSWASFNTFINYKIVQGPYIATLCWAHFSRFPMASVAQCNTKHQPGHKIPLWSSGQTYFFHSKTISIIQTSSQPWNLSKILHRRIFRLKISHRQSHLISTVLVRKNTKNEWKWRIYTAGKNFTLPPAVTAWTNSTPASSSQGTFVFAWSISSWLYVN